MDAFDPAEWKYRAEGNKHIVVSNEKGRVLRLQKESPFIQNGDSPGGERTDTEDSSVSQVLKFQEHVALPLLRNSDACHVAKQVTLSDDFIRRLSSNIESQRPDNRKHKYLRHGTKGILMYDHCFMPKEATNIALKHLDTVSHVNDTMSIEIKPKLGFMLPSAADGEMENVCQFCKTQLYRVQHEKRITDCSYYCPLDLFSGDSHRMKTAMKGLLNNPQNNFRIFKNGKLAYGHELLRKTSLRSSPNKKSFLAKSILHQLLLPFICGSDEELSANELTSVFIDIVCNALLLPIVKKFKSFSESGSHSCQGFHFKDRLKGQETCDRLVDDDTNNSGNLPNNSILALILAIQKLNLHSVDEINNFYEDILSDDLLHERLGLDAPYTSAEWQKFLQLVKFGDEASTFDDNLAMKVRRFLVSKSFSDCSIMISMRKLEYASDDVAELKHHKPTALCNLIHDRLGNSYVVSIGVVDLDPKNSSRIPSYHQYNQKLKEWWKLVYKHKEIL